MAFGFGIRVEDRIRWSSRERWTFCFYASANQSKSRPTSSSQRHTPLSDRPTPCRTLASTLFIRSQALSTSNPTDSACCIDQCGVLPGFPQIASPDLASKSQCCQNIHKRSNHQARQLGAHLVGEYVRFTEVKSFAYPLPFVTFDVLSHVVDALLFECSLLLRLVVVLRLCSG